LKELDPYKIILFGSLSKQNNDEESDIDLLVILNNDKISKNYKEKMEKKLLVRNLIWDLSKEIPIDLLVYTKREFEIIMENKNSFFKELEKTGKTIYEKAS
jgi:predicted nucleotidyltransferase